MLPLTVGSVYRTTSLAIEFLSQVAAQPEWEEVLYIDVTIINKLALWLCSQQNVTTGAFPHTSYVYDIKLHVRRNKFIEIYICVHVFVRVRASVRFRFTLI